MTLYVVRLRGDAVPPADRASTIGRVHVVDPEAQRGHRWAFRGVPTICGKELAYLRRPTLNSSSQLLWLGHTIEPDMLDWRCKGCFRDAG